MSEPGSPPTSSSSAFVLGLDWIDVKKGWACCRLGTDSTKEFHLSHLSAEEAPNSPGVKEAACVVIDAPIGLPSEEGRVSVCRACDTGAKVWLGGLKSSVFGPPVQGQLDRWRAGAKSPGGHAQGLLPAIHYAERIRDASSEGRPERLAADSQDYLMALPGAGYSIPENGPITEEELFALASEFTLSSSKKDPV